MKNLQIILILLISLTLPAIVNAQNFLWEEDFSVNPGNWTLGTNWSIASGYLQFNWSPTQENYDLSATSPVITLPPNTGDLHVTQWVNYFTTGSNEAFEIAVLQGDNVDVLWTHDTGVDWGSSGGEVITLSLIAYHGQDIQLRFRSWGASTWNINYWRIYHLGIEGTHDNDLQALSISGNTSPSVGFPADYTIRVRNLGMNTQHNYLVKLMQAGGTEIAVLQGYPITFGETIDYTLNWTPTAAGQTQLYGEVILAGDEDPDNNTTPPLNISVFEEGTVAVTIGNQTNLTNSIPLTFSNRNSLSQTIYMASDIQMNGPISGIVYYNSFSSNLTNKPVNIWIGETEQSNLTAGWIPSTDLEPVFNGTVNFPNGTNMITINFDEPYEYEGSNLVIMAQRPMDFTNFSTTNRFYHTITPDHPNRTRHISSDSVQYDPQNPAGGTLLNDVPNTTLLFSPSGTGILDGQVTVAGSTTPLAGTQIRILDTGFTITTNNNGLYMFPYVPEGTYDIQASLFGYYTSVSENVQILEDDTTTVNFSLSPLPSVTVSGRVVGSDYPDIGLDNATISVSGYFSYQTGSDNNGLFTIPGVYADQTYTFHVQRPGYSDLVTEIPIGSTNTDVGDLIVNEIAYPPSEVTATISTDNTEAYVNWTPPSDRYEALFSIDPHGLNSNFHNPERTNDRVLVGNIIYRLEEGQEESPQDWTEIATIISSDNTYTDTGISSLQNGIYLYAVRSLYSNNVVSEYALSNTIIYEEHIPGITNIQAETTENGVYLTWEWDERQRSSNHQKKDGLSGSLSSLRDERAFLGFILTRNGAILVENVMETSFHDVNLIPGVTDYHYTVIGLFTNGSTNMLQIECKYLDAADEEILSEPKATMLHNNIPNPFNPATTINYDLGKAGMVSLEIYNVKGQLIRTLVNNHQPPGSYSITWNGKDASGRNCSSGIFFYRLRTESYTSVRKMIMLK